MSKKTKHVLETNKERVIRELKQLGYDLTMAAERAVENFTHKPDSVVSFDETETISYFNNGEVNISLTGLDIIERNVVEDQLALFAAALENDVHICLKEVINEYTK